MTGPATRRRRNSGISRVEVCVIICVVGTLFAVFIPAFVRELRTSKTSEAAEQLELLYQRSAAYFVRRSDGASECLPPIAGPAPAQPSRDQREIDFSDAQTPGHATWAALGFQPPIEVRYSYTFEPTASGCGLRSPEGTYLLTLRAEGDLDSDGERSVFERRARANDDGELEPTGILFIRDRVE